MRPTAGAAPLVQLLTAATAPAFVWMGTLLASAQVLSCAADGKGKFEVQLSQTVLYPEVHVCNLSPGSEIDTTASHLAVVVSMYLREMAFQFPTLLTLL